MWFEVKIYVFLYVKDIKMKFYVASFLISFSCLFGSQGLTWSWTPQNGIVGRPIPNFNLNSVFRDTNLLGCARFANNNLINPYLLRGIFTTGMYYRSECAPIASLFLAAIPQAYSGSEYAYVDQIVSSTSQNRPLTRAIYNEWKECMACRFPQANLFSGRNRADGSLSTNTRFLTPYYLPTAGLLNGPGRQYPYSYVYLKRDVLNVMRHHGRNIAPFECQYSMFGCSG
jgi:hypothetical protein